MKSYMELDAWKQARALVKDIYEFTATFPSEERFGLISQLRRAAVSVPSNIAEGLGRNHTKDCIQFLYIAKGSLNEIETQLYLAVDLSLCKEQSAQELVEKTIQTRRLLIGFIKYKETAILSTQHS